MSFTLISNDFRDGERLPEAQVFNRMGFSGENVSPHLRWDGVPEGTKSFVVTCFDPDAPTGSGWWHWVVFNIPAEARELPRGAGSALASLPPGAVQSRTDFGPPGYGGAAPPPGGVHHYIFKVQALNVAQLDLNSEVSAAMVGFYAHFNGIGTATLTALYDS